MEPNFDLELGGRREIESWKVIPLQFDIVRHLVDNSYHRFSDQIDHKGSQRFRKCFELIQVCLVIFTSFYVWLIERREQPSPQRFTIPLGGKHQRLNGSLIRLITNCIMIPFFLSKCSDLAGRYFVAWSFSFLRHLQGEAGKDLWGWLGRMPAAIFVLVWGFWRGKDDHCKNAEEDVFKTGFFFLSQKSFLWIIGLSANWLAGSTYIRQSRWSWSFYDEDDGDISRCMMITRITMMTMTILTRPMLLDWLPLPCWIRIHHTGSPRAATT